VAEIAGEGEKKIAGAGHEAKNSHRARGAVGEDGYLQWEKGLEDAEGDIKGSWGKETTHISRRTQENPAG